jgi:hypothetical protein
MANSAEKMDLVVVRKGHFSNFSGLARVTHCAPMVYAAYFFAPQGQNPAEIDGLRGGIAARQPGRRGFDVSLDQCLIGFRADREFRRKCARKCALRAPCFITWCNMLRGKGLRRLFSAPEGKNAAQIGGR